jgi:two-component system phosphate regulon sensor histidine kinase PhoR
LKLNIRGRLFVAHFVLIALSSLSALLLADAGFPGVLGVFAVALLVTIIVANLGARTTRALTEVATKMASGDLDVRARIDGRDQLGLLGAALDQLAHNLSSTLRQLRAEHDRLETVLSGMTEGVLLLDRKGRVALVNRALRSMSLLGTDVEGKAPIEVIRNAELTELLERALEAGAPVSGELELNTPTTSRVLVRTRPLSGRDAGLVAVFVDVTDLRRLESVRKEFVANASHELRTPIASIHSSAETLLAGAAELPENRAKFLDIILRNSTRLRQLVDDMLDLSRAEARAFALVLRPVQVASVVSQICSALASEASRKRIELLCVIPDEIRVIADQRALEHVLMNLLDNAIKYCGDGSRVVVSHEIVGERVKLLVTDNGPGIDAKHLPRLFERFYRVDAGRSRDLGGTGLGLAIVKHLVEAMKGTTTVESELGKGTSFIVRLPVA